MQVIQHNIEVESNLQAAFNFCFDIKKWPKYFEPCKKIDVLFQDTSKQVLEVEATAGKATYHWRSERLFDYENNIIYFRQINPVEIFEWMEGTWRFFKTKEGVLISLEHHFQLKDSAPEKVENARNMIAHNSQLELPAMKKILESRQEKING